MQSAIVCVIHEEIISLAPKRLSNLLVKIVKQIPQVSELFDSGFNQNMRTLQRNPVRLMVGMAKRTALLRTGLRGGYLHGKIACSR